MKLIYKIGRERGEIVEKQDFNESIFAEQYVRALSFVSKFVDSKENSNNLNVIAFAEIAEKVNLHACEPSLICLHQMLIPIRNV